MAFVIALLVVIPHVVNPGRYDLVSIIIQSVPQVALLLVASMMIMYTIGSTAASNLAFGSGARKLQWVIVAIVIFIFADNFFRQGSYGLISQFRHMRWFGGGDIQAIILMIALFGGIIWFITKPEDGGSDDNPKTGTEG